MRESSISTFIIAEAGVNHNGSLDTALQLVDTAAEAGADAIKFQTLKAQHLVSRSAPKAAYQLGTTASDESQFEMIRKLELDDEMHRVLREAAAAVPPRELDRGSAQRGVTRRALLTGVAAHDLYHAGQIQLLKRLASS